MSGYRQTTATMPPKKAEKGPAKKVDVKKTVDDKTFGMKNKKGGAAQRQIKQIQAQAKSGGTAEQKKKDAEKAQREREKAAAEAAKREQEALLNKPAQVQKVPFGVDPKTVLCIFHKKGNCEKGKKCKFSHDLELDRKTEKKSLYQDTRQDEDEKKKAETSADWDEEKLRSVVLSKKGNQRTTTDKVCKYFVSAIEDGKYGWFWICPNGGDKCMYKHALPPGYVLIEKPQLWLEPVLLTRPSQVHPQDQGATGGGEGLAGQIAAQDSDARRVPGIGEAQADWHADACDARIIRGMEEEATGQEGCRRTGKTPDLNTPLAALCC